MEILEGDTEDRNRNLAVERDQYVSSMISSLNDTNSGKPLENVELCMKYLPTYAVSQAVEELLKYVVPVIKQSLSKIYDDNLLLSDTVDDDIVINILKGKLQVAIEFIKNVKTILHFVTKQGDINLIDLNNIPINIAEIILLTFEHCKNSGDEYKTTFNTELLDIFRLTRDVHSLFLKLFESCVLITNAQDNSEIGELKKVLEIICSMNEVLSEISIKSMSDNWKGYIAIIQTFSTVLGSTIDLKLPMQSLTALISKNLSSLCSEESVDPKLFVQVVKICGFLVKVALKIFDIFWNYLEDICQELLTLCCIIYGYRLELLCIEEHTSEASVIVKSVLYNSLEPFLLRLTLDPLFVKVFYYGKTLPSGHRFGFMTFLKSILHLVAISNNRPENFDIGLIIGALFSNTKQCYAELFKKGCSTTSMFDELVLNITASVLVYGDYAKIESILLENILQEDIWSAFLAIEVWTLLLHNATAQLCLDTLLNIIQKYQEIDFGIYTSRPEKIYLKCLIRRVYSMLPYYMKNDIITRYNPTKNIDIWKIIGLKYFPVQQKSVIEHICEDIVNTIETLERGSVNNFTSIAEGFEVLSTTNFNQLGINPTRLMKSVVDLWEFEYNHNLKNNNAFRYFISKLLKITSIFMSEFNSKELMTVLTRLKFISNEESFKLPICELFFSLSRSSRYNQDESKINTLLSTIIYPNLLCTKKLVIRQRVLEVIHDFIKKGRHDIIENITSDEMQRELSNYLEKNVSSCKFDRAYFTLLGSFQFQHECITWKTEVSQPISKKRKITEPTFTENVKQQRNVKEEETKNNEIIKAIPEINTCQSSDESVAEVLNAIKGDVKCLLNVLKTEKLSRKNASDIKLIANQLLSLL